MSHTPPMHQQYSQDAATSRRSEGAFVKARELVRSLGSIIKADVVAELPMNTANKYFNSEWRRQASSPCSVLLLRVMATSIASCSILPLHWPTGLISTGLVSSYHLTAPTTLPSIECVLLFVCSCTLFRKFIIVAVIILLIFIYFNHSSGMNLSTFFETIFDGLKNLF